MSLSCSMCEFSIRPSTGGICRTRQNLPPRTGPRYFTQTFSTKVEAPAALLHHPRLHLPSYQLPSSSLQPDTRSKPPATNRARVPPSCHQPLSSLPTGCNHVLLPDCLLPSKATFVIIIIVDCVGQLWPLSSPTSTLPPISPLPHLPQWFLLPSNPHPISCTASSPPSSRPSRSSCSSGEAP